MRLFRTWSEVPAPLKGGVVALGNFDGLHRGHRAVIGRAVEIAHGGGVAAAVMTFEPHPRLFFNPNQEPFRLSPFRIKTRLIEALGVDYLHVQTFDKDFSMRTAENFIDEILVGGLGVSHVVVGFDFVFGHKRGGNVALLKEKAAQHGFGVTSVEQLTLPGGTRFSSTNIRNHLKQGECLAAARLLGRYWEIEGRVEHGDARGRELNMPTANLHLRDELRPKFGVYAVRAGVDQGAETVWYDGVANFGIRPMFESKEPLLETHLFGFSGDLYGRHLRVAFIEYLRPEMKFDGLEPLKAQMAEDGKNAKAVLAARQFPAKPTPFVPVE